MIEEELRVLAMISNLANPGTGNVIGGGEIRAIEILKRWQSWGIGVETLETEPSPSKVLKVDYDIHAVSLPCKGYNTLALFLNAAVLMVRHLWISFSLRDRVNVVVAFNSTFINVTPAWLFNKLFRKPFIVGFQISSYAPSFSASYRIKRQEGESIIHSLWLSFFARLTIRLARNAVAVYCLSQPIADMLKILGFAEERLHVNGMGLNLETIDKVPEEEKEYDAIFLGRVEKHKGAKDLLDAWEMVLKENPEARLVIVGAGDFLEEAKHQVYKANINSRIKFTGFISGEERFSYLKRSKVLLYPSRIMEGWGLSIAEALACGLPVVCSDNPVFKAIFGDCASVHFTAVGDVESLAQVLLNLLQDETQLEKYGETSKAYARQFDWDSIARRELEVLRACIRK
jgi:glycosyltransferase involved in cell wall biosynthesis